MHHESSANLVVSAVLCCHFWEMSTVLMWWNSNARVVALVFKRRGESAILNYLKPFPSDVWWCYYWWWIQHRRQETFDWDLYSRMQGNFNNTVVLNYGGDCMYCIYEITNTMGLMAVLTWKLKLWNLVYLSRVYRWGAGQTKELKCRCITLWR